MEYRNPVFTKPSEITCEINHDEYGWIPFTCHRDDTGATFDVAALYDTMAADSSIVAYVAPTQEELTILAASQLRFTRNLLLEEEVDPFVTNPLRWNALTSEQQTEATTYRQALLDVPSQPTFPDTVTWPTKPDWM